jgi:glycosyltransferase involved in cell wall biosynthesis
MALLEELIAGYGLSHRFPFLWQEPLPEPAPYMGIDDLLSVVIPFFNLGAYLDDCIDSILACSWRRLEILVVNDGSTDAGSLTVLDRWREHPEVTVIDQNNRGLAAARNAGAQRAAGRFLAFVDADDKVTSDYYEKAIGVLTWYDNVHFVGCWVRYFGGAAGVWPAFLPGPPYLLTHNPVNSSGLVYKTASFLAAGLNDRRLEYGLEDYESVVSMVSQGFNGVVLPEALHLYRVRTGSMIRRMSRVKLLNAHGYIVEKHRAYYQQFAVEVVQLLNSNGPGYLFENPTTEVFVRSSWTRPRGWRAVIKRLVRRNKTLKVFLLAILKKTEHLWQKQ